MSATSTPTTDSPSLLLRALFATLLVLAFAGLGVAAYLTHIHHATHTDPGYESVCAVSDEINCETVARSPYSVFLGAPVSAWGLLGYLLIGGFAAWGVFGGRLRPAAPFGILWALVLCAATSSAILGVISFTRIDSLCIFCMVTYGINGVMLIVTAVAAIKERLNPAKLLIQEIVALLDRPALAAGIALPVLGVTAGLMFAVPPYWQRPGWDDIPSLPTGVSADGQHWIGAEKPLLTIVEYSDYQCPFCRRAHRDIRMTAAKFPGEVRLVHRHYPLDDACNKKMPRAFHAFACRFAKAAVCAAEQEKFWEMNDALFSIQDKVKAADVNVEYLAVELGLDRSQFVSCMARPEIPAEVARDIAAGERLELAGTPTFFINGRAFEGGVPESVIRKNLAQIHKNRAAVHPNGASPDSAASNTAK